MRTTHLEPLVLVAVLSTFSPACPTRPGPTQSSGGQGGGGTGGVSGSGGVGGEGGGTAGAGGNACVNVDGNDANNCGACGHSCAGGTCSAGQCQALSLGTIPSGNTGNLVLSGGDLYVITAALGTPSSVWQLSSGATSTPIPVASSLPSTGTPRCVMDGKLFWTAPSTGTNMPTPIQWCAVSNCAATTAPLLTSPGQAEYPVCDTTTDELVWADSTYPAVGGSDSVVTIYRARTDGSNMRTLTSFYEVADGDNYNALGFPDGRADRYFFTRSTVTPSNLILYYVATDSPGVSPVQIASGTPGQHGLNPARPAWANDTLYIWDDNSGASPVSYDVPLPNGVTGAAPVFFEGLILDGIMDSKNFYGTFTTLPADEIGACSISSCTTPSSLFRGQQNASAFIQDSTAIYWTTPSLTGNGFTVWKGAK